MERDPAGALLQHGPFERFISAAITAMFAIILAWRILLERDEDKEMATERKPEKLFKARVEPIRTPLPIVICTNEFEETDEVDNERDYKPPYSFLYSDSETSDEHLDTITEEGTDDLNSSGDSTRLERIKETRSTSNEEAIKIETRRNSKSDSINQSTETSNLINNNYVPTDSLPSLAFQTREQSSDAGESCNYAIKTIQYNYCLAPPGAEVNLESAQMEISLVETKRVREIESFASNQLFSAQSQTQNLITPENSAKIEQDKDTQAYDSIGLLNMSKNLTKSSAHEGNNWNNLKVRDESINFDSRNPESGASKKLRQLLAREAARKQDCFKDSIPSNSTDDLQIKIIPLSEFMNNHHHSLKRCKNDTCNCNISNSAKSNRNNIYERNESTHNGVKTSQPNDSSIHSTIEYDTKSRLKKNIFSLDQSVKELKTSKHLINSIHEKSEMKNCSPLIIDSSAETLSSPPCGRQPPVVNNTRSSEPINFFFEKACLSSLEQKHKTNSEPSYEMNIQTKVDNNLATRKPVITNSILPDCTSSAIKLFNSGLNKPVNLTSENSVSLLNNIIHAEDFESKDDENHISTRSTLLDMEVTRDFDEPLIVTSSESDNTVQPVPSNEQHLETTGIEFNISELKKPLCTTPPKEITLTTKSLLDKVPSNLNTKSSKQFYNLTPDASSKENEKKNEVTAITDFLPLKTDKGVKVKSEIPVNLNAGKLSILSSRPTLDNNSYYKAVSSNEQTSREHKSLMTKDFFANIDVTRSYSVLNDGTTPNDQLSTDIKKYERNKAKESETLPEGSSQVITEKTMEIPELIKSVNESKQSRESHDVGDSINYNSINHNSGYNIEPNTLTTILTEQHLELSNVAESQSLTMKNKVSEIQHSGKENEKLSSVYPVPIIGQCNRFGVKSSSDKIQKWQSVENELEKLNNCNYHNIKPNKLITARSEFFKPPKEERRKSDALFEKFKAKTRIPNINIAPSIPHFKDVVGRSGDGKKDIENKFQLLNTAPSQTATTTTNLITSFGFEKNREVTDEWSSILSSKNLSNSNFFKKSNISLKSEEKYSNDENNIKLATCSRTASKVKELATVSQQSDKSQQEGLNVKCWTITFGEKPSSGSIQNFFTASRRSSKGYIETDLDTGKKTEVILQETNLDEVIKAKCETEKTRANSLVNLVPKSQKKYPNNAIKKEESTFRTKSLDYLLDVESKESVKPPENELKKMYKQSDRLLSSPEIKFRKSFEKLNVPEWFKKSKWSSQDPSGFILNANKPISNDRYPYLAAKSASASALNSNIKNTQPKIIIPQKRIPVVWNKVQNLQSQSHSSLSNTNPVQTIIATSKTSNMPAQTTITTSTNLKHSNLETKEYTLTFNKLELPITSQFNKPVIPDDQKKFMPTALKELPYNNKLLTNLEAEASSKIETVVDEKIVTHPQPSLNKLSWIYTAPPLETNLDDVLIDSIPGKHMDKFINDLPMETDLDAIFDDLPNHKFSNLFSLQRECSDLFSSNLSPIKYIPDRYPVPPVKYGASVPSQSSLRQPVETSLSPSCFDSNCAAAGSPRSTPGQLRSAANKAYH